MLPHGGRDALGGLSELLIRQVSTTPGNVASGLSAATRTVVGHRPQNPPEDSRLPGSGPGFSGGFLRKASLHGAQLAHPVVRLVEEDLRHRVARGVREIGQDLPPRGPGKCFCLVLRADKRSTSASKFGESEEPASTTDAEAN